MDQFLGALNTWGDWIIRGVLIVVGVIVLYNASLVAAHGAKRARLLDQQDAPIGAVLGSSGRTLATVLFALVGLVLVGMAIIPGGESPITVLLRRLITALIAPLG